MCQSFPRYFTYDTFVQEENLPQLDLQELLDNAMDIKLTPLGKLSCTLAVLFMHRGTIMRLAVSKLRHKKHLRLLDDIVFALWLPIMQSSDAVVGASTMRLCHCYHNSGLWVDVGFTGMASLVSLL